MPSRLRFRDWRLSRAPGVLGICPSNAAKCAEFVNAAQQRLMLAREAGDQGWQGSWARMAFEVTPSDPFITTPREVARLVNLTICNKPVPIQNSLYEFLMFGNGTLPNTCSSNGCTPLQAYARNNAISFFDLIPPNKKIRVRRTDVADATRRVLIQGKDANGEIIYSQDGSEQVEGIYLELGAAFSDTPMEISKWTGVQKDQTFGVIRFYEVDTITAVERLLLTMQPTEEIGSYARYLLSPLPAHCCSSTATTVQVEAIAKLELIPVQVDSDYTLITNLEALIAECESIRYSSMDSPSAKQMAQERHVQAIRLLQGELVHYQGRDRAAISFKPFGSAALVNRRIGTLY